VVTPASRKPVVRYMIAHHGLSERAACRLAGVSRTGFRYVVKPSSDDVARERLKELAEKYKAYGYLLLHALLKREGLVVNRKHTYRLYREEGLQVRTKKRKWLYRTRVELPEPTAIYQQWSMDFVADQLINGRRFRVLNVTDNFNRELVGQLVAFSISGERVARFLSQLGETRALRALSWTTALNLPRKLCLNGPKTTALNCSSYNQASRLRMHLSKASTANSETNA